MSDSPALARAVVGDLNGLPWRQSFTAAYGYAPVFDLEEVTDGLKVTVVPGGVEFEAAQRGADFADRAVIIAVERKITPNSTAEIDDLMSLAEEIAGHFRGRRLEGFPDAVPLDVEVVAPFVPENLRNDSVFRSFARLKWRKLAARGT